MRVRKWQTVSLTLVVAAGSAALYVGLEHDHTKRAGRSPARVASPEPNQHEMKVLAEALRKKPDHTPLLLRMAQLSSQSHHPEEAVKYLRQIVQKEPDNPDARLELGKALFEAGDLEGAVSETKLLLEKRPAYPDALYNLGAIYANLGNGKLARDFWQQLITGSPGSESARRAQQMLAQLR
jgi:Flp pilus assembly protein TadD